MTTKHELLIKTSVIGMTICAGMCGYTTLIAIIPILNGNPNEFFHVYNWSAVFAITSVIFVMLPFIFEQSKEQQGVTNL
jgi:hypothetical protein